MVQTTIRSTRELPEWFDLTKYEDFKKLDAAGWYKALVQRASHLNFMTVLGGKKFRAKKSLYPNLLALRENPFYVPTDEKHLSIIGGNNFWAIEKRRTKFSKFLFAIAPLTLRKLYQKEHYVRDETRLKVRAYMDALYDNPDAITEDDEEQCAVFLDEPFFDVLKTEGNFEPGHNQQTASRTKDLVEVDFSLPDKVLKEQFAKYLKQTRLDYPEIKASKGYKRPNFDKWYEYGLIPYLDLQIWSQENDCKIPYRVMADAIFCNMDKGEEAVRKTVKPLAEEATYESFIKFFACLVAEEAREKA